MTAWVPEFAKEKILVTVISMLNKLMNTANADSSTQEEGTDKRGDLNKNDIDYAYRIRKYNSGSKWVKVACPQATCYNETHENSDRKIGHLFHEKHME